MSCRPSADREVVRRLLGARYSARRIAVDSGVPASTVARWKREFGPIEVTWRPVDETAYAYLLGMYLGDGCVYVNRRGGALLRITLDSAYPEVVEACRQAMQTCMPDNRTGLVPRRDSRATEVQC